MDLPTWLYHKDFGAEIFHTEKEVKKAERNGWVDSPANINEQKDTQEDTQEDTKDI